MGELREAFIKRIICDEFESICLHKGILEVGNWQSPEIDFIWLKPNARVSGFRVFDGNDCRLHMEIKSTAKKEEFGYLNKYSGEIKQRCPENNIKSGMFCYSTQSNRKSVLKDFGFKYDSSIKAFKTYNKEQDVYPNIDFVFGLDLQSSIKRPYFVMRDFYGDNGLFLNEPVIDYFLDLFKR